MFLSLRGSRSKRLSPWAIQILVGIIICLTVSASQVFAERISSSSISGNPATITNVSKTASHSSIASPVNIVSNNRFVVGLTFSDFNFKKVYPYFSINLQNTHNPSFHPFENHHLYSGIMLLTLGKITNRRYLKTMGTVLIVDDLIEHGFNVESALHFTANHLDQPLYAKLTKDADALFGTGKR